MIIRIATEAQYDVPDTHRDRLNQYDNAAVEAVEAGDEAGFRENFEQLLRLVRADGTKLGDDDLCESDFILPPPDLSFEEAGQEFTGEGLIPD